MINTNILILFNLFMMLLAGVVGIIIVFTAPDESILIIEYEGKRKIFKSIAGIKKDVGASAFEAVRQFESDLNKIIIILYPNCKIIKNTLEI